MNEPELHPGAREIVDQGRAAQTPGDAQRERAYQALMAGIAGGAAVGAAKVGAASAARSAGFSALKWVIAAASIAAVGVGGYVASTRVHAPVMAASATAAPLASTPAPSVAEPAPPSALESALPIASTAPSVVSVPQLTSKVPPNKTNAGDLSEELSLLHRALAASRAGNPALALTLAQEHAKRFPSSHLGVERDAIEVRSLCGLGRAAEAHKIADRLQAQAPSSPVRAALEETCVGK